MTDPVITIYNQIIALIKAEPTLYDPLALPVNRDLIFPKNLITYSGSQPNPEKPGRGAGDFPELDIDEGNYADTGFTKWPTFETSRQGGTCGKQQITIIYILTLTARDCSINQISALRFAISRALAKGGSRLGFPDLVQSWGPISSGPPAKIDVKNSSSPAAEGTARRRVLKISVPVSFLFNNEVYT